MATTPTKGTANTAAMQQKTASDEQARAPNLAPTEIRAESCVHYLFDASKPGGQPIGADIRVWSGTGSDHVSYQANIALVDTIGFMWYERGQERGNSRDLATLVDKAQRAGQDKVLAAFT